MQTKTVATLLLTALPAVITANQGFSWDCSWWTLSGNVNLNTNCASWDPDKGKVASALNLNTCIGVDAISNTIMWIKDGNLKNWCSGCSFQDSETKMQCNCINQKTGETQSSSLDLDTGLINVQNDGTLAC